MKTLTSREQLIKKYFLLAHTMEMEADVAAHTLGKADDPLHRKISELFEDAMGYLENLEDEVWATATEEEKENIWRE